MVNLCAELEKYEIYLKAKAYAEKVGWHARVR